MLWLAAYLVAAAQLHPRCQPKNFSLFTFYARACCCNFSAKHNNKLTSPKKFIYFNFAKFGAMRCLLLLLLLEKCDPTSDMCCAWACAPALSTMCAQIQKAYVVRAGSFVKNSYIFFKGVSAIRKVYVLYARGQNHAFTRVFYIGQQKRNHNKQMLLCVLCDIHFIKKMTWNVIVILCSNFCTFLVGDKYVQFECVIRKVECIKNGYDLHWKHLVRLKACLNKETILFAYIRNM